MALTITRFLHTNLVQAAATVLSVSSEVASMPRGRLLFPLRSDVWRSAGPWVIVAGVNDRINFNRGGVKTATIAAGTYTTAAALCEAIRVAMEAADAPPVWASSYSGATFKFTISSDLAFTLLFSSGADKARSIAIDIGFAETDTGSATSQTAGSVSYQSRHWIHLDLGSALAFTSAAVINHNLSTNGTIRVDGHTATMVALGLQSTTPGFTQTLLGDSTIRIGYWASQSKQFVRFVISDVQNAAGYAELGIAFLGTYAQPSITYTIGWKKRWVELSTVGMADRGASWQTSRPRLREHSLSWSEIPDADRVLIEAAAAACPLGKPLFLALDAGVTDTNTIYGYFSEGVSIEGATTVYFNTGIVHQEAGG